MDTVSSNIISDVFIIGKHKIRCLKDIRALEVDQNKHVSLTPTEYSVIGLLLDSRPIDDVQLAATIFGTDSDMWTKDAFDRHIDNLRRKFKIARIGLYIHRIPEFGYVLTPLTKEKTTKYTSKKKEAS